MSGLSKVCEHLHLPLQSGSSRILRLMNRGYPYEDYRERIDALREGIPGIAITTDIITGFPGETEDDHAQTIRALKEIEFDGVFAFKFSPRPGTAAAAMDNQIEDEIKSVRLSEILKLQDDITLKLNKRLEDSIQEVLVEGVDENDDSLLTGRTRSNKIVNFKGPDSCIGGIVKVKIVEARRHSLRGVAL